MTHSQQTQHPELYAEIQAFCAAHGVSRSRFGIDALGDPAFMWTFEAGRELRRSTIAAIRLYMASGASRAEVATLKAAVAQ